MDSSAERKDRQEQIGPDVEAAIGDTSCNRCDPGPDEDSNIGNVTGGPKSSPVMILHVKPDAKSRLVASLSVSVASSATIIIELDFIARALVCVPAAVRGGTPQSGQCCVSS
jgi:hypothetical protein